MNAGWLAYTIAIFLLGVLAGGMVWIPYTIRETNRRFEARMRLARRYWEKDASTFASQVAHDEYRGKGL